jgi:GTP cyclohydrolase I
LDENRYRDERVMHGESHTLVESRPQETMQVQPREVVEADWQRYRRYMSEIFTAFGMQPATPGTERTPERFLRALYALCEHHALPFYGFAHVGYVAHERIIGISKLTRLVRLFARRFTVQERLGEEIADALMELMEPHGVAVHLEAVHLCTQMRGVREEHSKTMTSVWRSGYTDNPELRREFLAEIGKGNPWT